LEALILINDIMIEEINKMFKKYLGMSEVVFR
jgi:hypothetical protein